MKKLYTTEKYKKRNKRHAEKSLERKLAFKEYQKQKNNSELGLGKSEREHKKVHEDAFKDYIKVHAPQILSFIDNSDEVVEFIDKLKKQYDLENKVWVVLKNVEQITYDAIVVLLSIMVKFKASKIAFNGDFPENKEAKKILEESKFLKYLYQQFSESERYNLGQKSSIHTHAWKDVD